MNTPTTPYELIVFMTGLKTKLPYALLPIIMDYVYKESNFAEEVAALIKRFRYVKMSESPKEAFCFQSEFGSSEKPIGRVVNSIRRDPNQLFLGNYLIINGKKWYGSFIHADDYSPRQRKTISKAMVDKTWTSETVSFFPSVEDKCLAALVAGRSYKYYRFVKALDLFYDLKEKAPLVFLIVGILGNDFNYKLLPNALLRDRHLMRLVSKTILRLKDKDITAKFVSLLEKCPFEGCCTYLARKRLMEGEEQERPSHRMRCF